MNLLGFFQRRPPSSAPAARERLQVLLAHERATIGQSDLVATLREEILAVIAKHVSIDREKVKVTMDKRDQISMLEVDIELPGLALSKEAAPAH
ncbi:cell division topological specificity factor MinE [Aureimonas mangrovi]|jgi:cell division topological specificity factor|uniref:cell division topological specificity factor MinE n=1 Tax=Aureimonas mangrovi TaxID=2758041 RepID=UPI00163D9F8D|nr:cell division topological specificity factor MinE [Aureimonas mangrovi]